MKSLSSIRAVLSTKISSCCCSSQRSIATSAKILSKQEPAGYPGEGDLRTSVAPWLRIGEYRKGMLSHLSTSEILRALFVLKVCSMEKMVDKSPELFQLATKLGPLAKLPIRKTFYDQFVGGETRERMSKVVDLMHKRGLRLMVAPVLEQDLEDAKSSSKTYDGNLSSLLDLAEMCQLLENQKPLLQLKLSALIPPNTLVKVTEVIEAQCGYDPLKLAKMAEGFANAIDSPSTFSLELPGDDRGYFLEGLKRAETLVKKVQELSGLVVVDAEFYSCQRAISTVALALMLRYNQKNQTLVGNTIQAYLKDAVQSTQIDLEATSALSINWYGKIVRGAYMDRERRFAQDHSLESPICDSAPETSASYNHCINLVLQHLASGSSSNSQLLVATHNENSIRIAAQRIKTYGIPVSKGPVAFGHIYGMADYLSTPLVENGYTVYKSVPYGPLEKVMPYLSRRASENKAVVQGAREERVMLGRELRSRLRLG